MSTTADAARSAISAAESAPAESNVRSAANAHEHIDVARQEVDHLVNSGYGDPNSLTRRAAAAALVASDTRPYVATRHGQIRRAFEAGDGITGSASTRLAAREAIDGISAWAPDPTDQKAAERIAEDKRTLAMRQFAADINRSTFEDTLPANTSADAITEAILRRRGK